MSEIIGMCIAGERPNTLTPNPDCPLEQTCCVRPKPVISAPNPDLQRMLCKLQLSHAAIMQMSSLIMFGIPPHTAFLFPHPCCCQLTPNLDM